MEPPNRVERRLTAVVMTTDASYTNIGYSRAKEDDYRPRASVSAASLSASASASVADKASDDYGASLDDVEQSDQDGLDGSNGQEIEGAPPYKKQKTREKVLCTNCEQCKLRPEIIEQQSD